jgi:hypothetical protein
VGEVQHHLSWDRHEHWLRIQVSKPCGFSWTVLTIDEG